MISAKEALSLTNTRVDDMYKESQRRMANEWKETTKNIKTDIKLFIDNILSDAIHKNINDGSYDLVICASRYNIAPFDEHNFYTHCVLPFETYTDKMVEYFVDILTESLSTEYGYKTCSRKNATDIIDPKLKTDDDYYTISIRWSEKKDDKDDWFSDDDNYDINFQHYA